MLYYTILHYTALYCTILYYTILYYTILYYTILYYTILYYTILYYTILYYTMLYYTILHYTALYCTILYYTILYYTILYYTILYYTILYYTILYYTILYYTILYYTVLGYVFNMTILSPILPIVPISQASATRSAYRAADSGSTSRTTPARVEPTSLAEPTRRQKKRQKARHATADDVHPAPPSMCVYIYIYILCPYIYIYIYLLEFCYPRPCRINIINSTSEPLELAVSRQCSAHRLSRGLICCKWAASGPIDWPSVILRFIRGFCLRGGQR